jgi:hypothetical protein
MLFLSSFDDYSWEPKEAPKDPEQDLYENRLRYATGHCPWQSGISFKKRNLLLFIINLVSATVHDLNSSSRTRLPSHFQLFRRRTRLLILEICHNFSILLVLLDSSQCQRPHHQKTFSRKPVRKAP